MHEKQTQTERVLEMLKRAGDHGVTSVDMVNAYILRGAAVIHLLKKDGHNIVATRVEGKTYARYTYIGRFVNGPESA